MRKTATITISAEGRDKDKTFFLEEMPALRAEKWALKAFMALARAGHQIPENIAEAGVAGVAALGIQALQGMSFEDAEPLIDEIMTCVKFMPDRMRPETIRPLFEGDIEEVMTSLRLKKEVVNLHISFSRPAGQSKVESPSAGTGWQSA